MELYDVFLISRVQKEPEPGKRAAFYFALVNAEVAKTNTVNAIFKVRDPVDFLNRVSKTYPCCSGYGMILSIYPFKRNSSEKYAMSIGSQTSIVCDQWFEDNNAFNSVYVVETLRSIEILVNQKEDRKNSRGWIFAEEN